MHKINRKSVKPPTPQEFDQLEQIDRLFGVKGAVQNPLKVPPAVYPLFTPQFLFLRQKIGNHLYINEVDFVRNEPVCLVKHFKVECFPPTVQVIAMEEDSRDKNSGSLLLGYGGRRLMQFPVRWHDVFIVEDKALKKKYYIKKQDNRRSRWGTYNGQCNPHYSFTSIVDIFEEVFGETCEECLLDHNSWLIAQFIELLYDTFDDGEITQLYNRKNLNRIVTELSRSGTGSFLWDFFKNVNNGDFCNNLKLRGIYIESGDITFSDSRPNFMSSIKDDFKSRTICTTNKYFYESLGLAAKSGGKSNVYLREDVLKKYFDIT